MSEHPHAPDERRQAARHLLQRPLTCAEHDPDVFVLIRRHADSLDRWFTQRLGWRLHVTGDTARLIKIGTLPTDRPLRAASGRAFHQREYTLLALTLAATVAGPSVVSLRDLVEQVRSAAADADVALIDDATGRRAQVTALRWMIDHGLTAELHDRVEAYADDAEADAVLAMRPDRIVLLALPAMVDAADGAELLERAGRRPTRRTWLRQRLVEDPVLARHRLADDEWDELRRRQSEEAPLLEEMFGLVLEARAEGVAAIDPDGTLSAIRFPAGGTVAHAALLFIGALLDHGAVRGGGDIWLSHDEALATLTILIGPRARRWRAELVERPELLLREVRDLLVSLQLAEERPDDGALRLLPVAARFRHVEERVASQQGSLL